MFQKIVDRAERARDRAVHAKLDWAMGWLASAQAALAHHVKQASARMEHHDRRIGEHASARERHAAAIASATVLADNLDKLQTTRL